MRYRVTGAMTISVVVDVDADSEEHAREVAEAAAVMNLCNQCAHGEPDEWSTSGELDGTVEIESVISLEDGDEADEDLEL